MTSPSTDYDNAWKDILEIYLVEFFSFFFPQVQSDINWSRGYEFLDKELQQVTREAETGKRYVDKLVKVWLHSGVETWVLVHIEVQSQAQAQFAERMLLYNCRLFDRYRKPVASLAVLADENPHWRPQQFSRNLWGCSVNFTFPAVKLLDYRKDWTALAANPNPFATVVMAHLKTQQTSQNRRERKQWKLRLTRRLYEQGYNRDKIISLFRFIDWLMSLPEGLEQEFWQELQDYEQEGKMPYITSVERIGYKRGKEEGRKEQSLAIVLRLLRRRVGALPAEVEAQVEQLTVAQLETLSEALLDFQSLGDLEAWLEQVRS